MRAFRSFRYFTDPACVISLIIYPINRFYLKPHHIGGWFTHGYLNDVLCLPLFVPMILYVQHIVGLRRHVRFPSLWEIFQSWAAFVLVFQVITPRYPKVFITAGDPFDILAYLVGGIVAGIYWHIASRGVSVEAGEISFRRVGVLAHRHLRNVSEITLPHETCSSSHQ